MLKLYERTSRTPLYQALGLFVTIVLAIEFLLTTPLIAESQVSLSIQPNSLEIPLIRNEYGQGRFYIELFVSNVTNLKSFKLSLIVNGDILSTTDDQGWYGDPTSWSGGGTSHGGTGYGSYRISDYQLRDPISGSGVLLKYWFVPKSIGITQVQLKEVEFRDSTGNLIPVIVNNGVVEVVLYDGFMQAKYEALETDYVDVKTNYETLSNVHDELLLTYDNLQSKYESLNSDYETLNSTYISNAASYTSLKSEHLSLESEHLSLESAYAQVKLENTQLAQGLTEVNERNKIIMVLLYALIGLAAVLVCIALVLIIRNRRFSKRS